MAASSSEHLSAAECPVCHGPCQEHDADNGNFWTEHQNDLLVANMIANSCRGESTRFCCAYHEGFADGIVSALERTGAALVSRDDLRWLLSQVASGFTPDPDAPTFKRLMDAS